MINKKSLFLLILLLAFLGIPLAAQELKNKRKCPFCKTTGKLENPFYEKHKDWLENIEFSSWAIEKDTKGSALPWMPCERCRNAELKERAQKEFDRLAKRSQRWLEKRRKIDEELKVQSTLHHLQTEHFVWAWNIPKLSYKKKNYRSHEALFLYGERMEEFYDEFQAVHGITDDDNTHSFHQIFALERELVAKRACPLYGQQASSSGRVFLLGNPSVYVMWWNKSLMPTEEYLHRAFVHYVSHQLVAVYRTPWWLYESGWAFEGSAHWWEQYYYKKATCQCSREVNSLSGWVATKWESKVKKAVMSGDEITLVSMLGKNGGTLTAEDHIYAWSYVDYMMSMDPRKTLDFFVILKEDRPAREAFMEIWGMSVLGFEEKWREYVRAQYKVFEKVAPSKRIRSKRRSPVSEADETD
ncbi:MAG: hypothetical protein ACYTG7_02780 [Planctomycetota bacterium]|jgi:hypothetical protein